LAGHDDDVNGKTSVRNSWLLDTDDPQHLSRLSLSEEIKSLSQQLIQVKRRMWPVAEECAQVWNSTPEKEFWEARKTTNPMEGLGEGRHRGLNQMFMNRSAIKLANLDAILDFTLTCNSKSQTSKEGGGHFLFADLCGAPGGFSEYLMKRCRSNMLHSTCKGFGMSLLGNNEHGQGTTWRLQNTCQRHGSFHTSYLICNGADGTGDIYNWENVLFFQREIQRELDTAGITQKKMDLVVADGGFDAQRDSECQEELAQKLVLCELAAGLQLLEVGGTLVVKLFGSQTQSVRLAIKNLFEHFQWIREIKPISSRPASSERYAVFTGFKGLPTAWSGGPHWISSVLIANCLQYETSYYEGLDLYLDKIDRDMLVLNLKACFAILSHLERKTTSGKVQESLHGSNPMCQDKSILNVNRYKHAWQLFI
jgi:cap1 methyltransferase